MPARVGIRELRQNLSVYVGRVKEGEVFEVTEYGRPIATLGPLVEDPIDRLEREARLVQRARGDFTRLPPPLEQLPGERSWSDLLDELRDDRR